jgi:DnaJ-class molecular chaperone
MNKYQKINAARNVLELSERATMEEIKSNYRALIRKWHPDRCKANREKCKEMTTKIIAAYRIIYDYCNNYKFSFSEEEVSNYLSADEWWFERFGKNNFWGEEKKSK